MKKQLALLFALGLVGTWAPAQTPVPLEASHWDITGKVTKENYLGKECIRLTDGDMHLKDRTFKNGVIEVDVALSPGRYFPGLGFRVQDAQNMENVYVRPHQLGNPDAIQYQPVYHGQAAWQLYHGEGYSNAIRYPLDAWMHLRIVVRDRQALVYVDNQDQPALVIHQLKRAPQAGSISLSNGAPVAARFANFSYTSQDEVPLPATFKPEAAPEPGTLLRWRVSGTFDEKQLESTFQVPASLTQSLRWTQVPTEPSGLLNLAQLSGLSEAQNTAFAKVVITADRAQIKRLLLGFSDRARVYLNGKLLYAGRDEFMSRDYRYLGTVGYFDELYLDLKKGPNELWIAVSENFGGWGLKARLPDPTGVAVE
ncbi:hypothetical protein GCM10027275_41550 [Rhabdobacter roseus]|uniref:DUF1080 domain-containing protein n=1 Tax=Rhabdobacter roseus TaxID=1655419 RepID=A0A840TX01_9BACT|nr:hypothetical protein [Rhabdobacter roseus]MBB5286132.1 hypothetical protein [Rhabdobacter roseus]